MHFTNPFAFGLMFLSIISIAAPLSPPPTNVMHSVRNELDVRQLSVVGDILELCKLVFTAIMDIDSAIHDQESAFTQQMVSSLGNKYPGKNILIYHNPNSIATLSSDAVHAHYELPLTLSFTQGYEIWVFNSGTFTLIGDGGYENWATGGCFSKEGASLIYTQCS
ncbi:hypothetical protein PILCRDRAFT_15002 [Piloderma croceum F 1598]|uniref:Uncharacterized protein n=1 Tax=Piloderma croceum (strain F 1598) TaxID=765440 RepID=A0A0C3B8R5_PILCF|nr:hypothetical protein PILCRDRAFT_15002 [Piloderma croceum F 1598]